MRIRVLFALIALVWIAGCSGGIIRPKVEKGIARSLPEYIGPAEQYTVKASGPTTAMLHGRIQHLRIEGVQVEIADDMVLDRLVVDMDDVSVDPETRVLQSVGNAIFTAEMTQESVNRYVKAVRPDVQELKIELEVGKVVVGARPTVMGIGPRLQIGGRPEIVNRNKVNFVADSASLSILPVPALIVNKLLDSVNPVLDLSETRFPVALTAVKVRKGTVEIAGRAIFKTRAAM